MPGEVSTLHNSQKYLKLRSSTTDLSVFYRAMLLLISFVYSGALRPKSSYHVHSSME